MSLEQNRCAIVHFSGHVQGVGFRYTVMQLARGFEVCGFVRNEEDGRVLLEAEGRLGELDAFVGAIADRLVGYIRKCERQDGPATGRHRGFTIQ